MRNPESFWPSDMREQIKDDRDREHYMEAQAALPKKVVRDREGAYMSRAGQGEGRITLKQGLNGVVRDREGRN